MSCRCKGVSMVADIGGISELLHLLTGSGTSDDSGGSGSDGGSDIFGDIDPDMLIRIMNIISRLSEPDDSAALLGALRPYLRPENREKLDRAARIMKLIGIIPILRENGIDIF